jgi:hypothetical protein
VAAALLKAGMLVVPAGPRVVRFVPPLIITEAEIDSAMVKFEEACVALSSTPGPAPGTLTKKAPAPVATNWFQKLMSFGGEN